MASVTIVPDAVLSSLIAAQVVRHAGAEALGEVEQAFASFDPTAELLRKTIDAVFWASLAEEEGKPALARVRFADIRGPHCRLQPLDVSAEALRKLSPLMDVSSNALYIREDAKIVGVGPWHSFDFRIVAHRSARLAVLDGPLVLGVCDEGNWVIVGGSNTDFSRILQLALPDELLPDRFLKATLIVGLAMEARRAGRGATLVIVPADRQEGIGSVSYPVEEFRALPEAVAAWQRSRTATLPTAEKNRIRGLVHSAMTIAAAGAGIDGATLLDDSTLRLLGFGAKIDAQDDELHIALIELPSTSIRMIRKRDIGGMRQQTAARLVQLNHDATVITVSQDGPVSLFSWVDREAGVVVIKNLDRYLQAEAT